MRIAKYALPVAALSAPADILAQDLASQEIVVTAERIEQDDYYDGMPAVDLRRTADFLVQDVVIRGDTRDAEQREREIRAMLERAIAMAAANGVELSYGDYILTRLTAENAADLELANDRRPDSELVSFLVKAPLTGSTVSEAQQRIDRFIEAVPENGRAQMDAVDDPTLSVVGPDSYRSQIIAAVAQDAQTQASVLGEGYAIELAGLNMPVQRSRAGPGEVLLYIPYELRIVPRP